MIDPYRRINREIKKTAGFRLSGSIPLWDTVGFNKKGGHRNAVSEGFNFLWDKKKNGGGSSYIICLKGKAFQFPVEIRQSRS